MLELSDNAVREIKELTQGGGLRFVAHEGDDGSTSFDPSLADEPEEGDVVVERDGARVFLDAARGREAGRRRRSRSSRTATTCTSTSSARTARTRTTARTTTPKATSVPSR